MTNFKRNESFRGSSGNSGIVWYVFIGIALVLAALSCFSGNVLSDAVRVITVDIFGIFAFVILAQVILISSFRLARHTPKLKFFTRLLICVSVLIAFIIAQTVFQMLSGDSALDYTIEFSAYFDGTYMFTPGGGFFGMLANLMNTLVSPVLSIVLFSLALIMVVGYLLKDYITEKISLLGRAKKYSPREFKKKYPQVYVTLPSTPQRARLFVEDLNEYHRTSEYDRYGEPQAKQPGRAPVSFDTTSESILKDFKIKNEEETRKATTLNLPPEAEKQPQPKMRPAPTSVVTPDAGTESSVVPKVTVHEGHDKIVIIPDGQSNIVTKKLYAGRIYTAMDFRPSAAQQQKTEPVQPQATQVHIQPQQASPVPQPERPAAPQSEDAKRFVSSFKKPEVQNIGDYSRSFSEEDIVRDTPDNIFSSNKTEEAPKEPIRQSKIIMPEFLHPSPAEPEPEDELFPDNKERLASFGREEEPAPEPFKDRSDELILGAKIEDEPYEEEINEVTEPDEETVEQFAEIDNAGTDGEKYDLGEPEELDLTNESLTPEDFVEEEPQPEPEQPETVVQEDTYSDLVGYEVPEEQETGEVYEGIPADDYINYPPDTEKAESFDETTDTLESIASAYFVESEKSVEDSVYEEPVIAPEPVVMEDEKGTLTIDEAPAADLTERTPLVDPAKDTTGQYTKTYEKPKKKNGIALDPNQEMMNFEPEYKFKEMAPYEFDEEYVAPSADLFEYSDQLDSGMAEAEEKVAALEAKLAELGFPAKVQDIICGPSVIRYELNPPPGMSIYGIKRFSYDIQAALAVGEVNILAPIPRKPFIGIEVRKEHPSMVRLRDFFESDEFKSQKNMLSIPMGYTIDGQMVIKSAKSLAHLLVGGQTRSGKSVFLNTMLLSLVLKYSPKELRLLLIDPKSIEFLPYDGLPHMLVEKSLHYDADNQVNYPLRAMQWLINEMERRYSAFRSVHEIHKNINVRNIGEFNELDEVKNGEWQKMPYIVVVMDEFADLCSMDKKDMMACVARLSAKSAACGIHLVVATQRPDVKIIDGTIKNNLPGRIAFKLQSLIDSRTILDEEGAQDLVGNGDMLFRSPTDGLVRMQAPFASTECVTEITNYIRDNNIPHYNEDAIKAIFAPPKIDIEDNQSGGDDEFEDKDQSLYPEIMRMFIKKKNASASMIQTKYHFGYSRATRIVGYFEDQGYISDLTSSRTREIYITPEKFEEVFGEPFDEGDI